MRRRRGSPKLSNAAIAGMKRKNPKAAEPANAPNEFAADLGRQQAGERQEHDQEGRRRAVVDVSRLGVEGQAHGQEPGDDAGEYEPSTQ